MLNILIGLYKPDIGFRMFKIRMSKYDQCFIQRCPFLVNLLKNDQKYNGNQVLSPKKLPATAGTTATKGATTAKTTESSSG